MVEYQSMAAELLANREAQPVMYASEETLAYAKEGEKSLVTWSEPMGDAVIPLFTVPPAPAPAIPDIGSSVVNDAAWKLHDTLTKYGPLNGHQFNHLKSCLYEALKIVMAAPEKN